jgi:hypothetical protein
MTDANVELSAPGIRRARLIVNPVSGGDPPNSEKLPDIVAMLEAGGIRPDVAFTSLDESPGQVAQRAAT